jgi:SAM-dependent methyltransferase
LTDHKQAEIDYPAAIGEEGRIWLRNKPFHHDPRMTSRLLIDFGHVLQILDLHAGMSLVELGCGSGWMTRFAARHGLDDHGYVISPEMIAIARELAEQDGIDAKFDVADMENLDLGRRFDAALLYDALHHRRRADLVLATARKALRRGGRLLLVEPNWKHRFQGRGASDEYGVTEMGYSPRRLKRLLREAGFTEITRFQNNRKRLYANSPREIAAHLAEPLVYRALGLFWTQNWLRATAP